MKTINHIIKRKLVSNILTVINESLPKKESDKNKNQLERELYKSIDNAFDGSLQTERKTVNILLSDLRGFSAMAEGYTPLVLMDLLNRYFLKMSEIIQKHNGIIDKFMGDSVMVLFGAPKSYSDDLERTLACAIEMQIAMSNINEVNEGLGMPSLYMGIGINTGEVVAGSLGSEFHNEYTVIGNEVNLVSRVEAHSLRGQILLSENSYQQAKDYIKVGEVNEIHVKGKTDTVKMYELLSISKPYNIQVPCREIRKSPRVTVNMPLAFFCVSGKEILPQEHIGRIIDISYSGLFAVIPVSLELHDEVKIVFSISLMTQGTRDVYAKVIHINKLENEFECHFEFTAIDRESKRELKDFVDLLIERKD